MNADRIAGVVLPVVLYNGEAPWTAPQTLQELILKDVFEDGPG